MTLVEMLVSMALSRRRQRGGPVAGRGGTDDRAHAAGDRRSPQRARVALQSLGRDVREAGARHGSRAAGGIAGGDTSRPSRRPPTAASPSGRRRIATRKRPFARRRSLGQPRLRSTTTPVAPQVRPPARLRLTRARSRSLRRGAVPLSKVSGTAGDVLQLASPLLDCALEAGSGIAEGSVRTYRVDAAARQLIRRDEVTGSSAPVLDGVTAMTVTYYADAAGTTPIGGTDDAELRRVRRVRIALRFVAGIRSCGFRISPWPSMRLPGISKVADRGAPRLAVCDHAARGPWARARPARLCREHACRARTSGRRRRRMRPTPRCPSRRPTSDRDRTGQAR
jgi:hypothetical protein